MLQTNKIIYSIALFFVSLAICLAAAEILLRVKNSSMKNYDIEMWRYAKELKVRSQNQLLEFVHLKSKSAVLQNVVIRLNEHGMRGETLVPYPFGGRRILFLGGSITLGWGVSEQETVEARLEKMFSDIGWHGVQVLNAGIGNYNTERYVSRFFSELTDLQPTDIVVHYFLRDAEDLPPSSNNFMLRHSELAVTLWIAYHRLFDNAGENSLVEHYRKVYQPNAPGMQKMKIKLKELADYAKSHGINIYLAMTPDVHNLVDYKFGFVHDIMRQVSAEYGFKYCDQLTTMKGMPPEDLWTMPGDPHPNALGHKLMADAIFPMLVQ